MSFNPEPESRSLNTLHSGSRISGHDYLHGQANEEDVINLQVRHHSSQEMKNNLLQGAGWEVDGGEAAYYQPAVWWFASTAFPLIAGTFGPIANLFSVCALVQTWRIVKPDNTRIADPAWVLAFNIASLTCAVIANLLLLFGFAKRISYRVAQPLTILPWYISCIFLIVPVAVTRRVLVRQDPSYELSESYYYGFIAAIIYFVLSTLLLLNLSGTYIFHAYPPSFSSLTIPQRTLMLQTISFSCYLALGAGIFAGIEGWQYVDGVYWADYTLLTVGLGSDFPLQKTAARMLVMPYAAIGVTSVGLIVNSVRGLVLERGKARLTKRRLEKERQKCETMVDRGVHQQDHGEKEKMKLGRKDGSHHLWRRKDFESMRHIEKQAKRFQEYIGLLFSVIVFAIVWVGGSIVFWALEHRPDAWTYPESLYFTYTSILTIGYGDFYPSTNASRPFFVIWSLVAVPAMTVLVSNMGETVFSAIDQGTVWVGQRSILPERREDFKKSSHVLSRLKFRRKDTEKGRAHDGGGHHTTENPSNSRSLEERQSIAQVEEQEVETGTGMETAEILRRQRDNEQTLTIRLAREIRQVARDAAQRPSHEYLWDEWVKWLRLMDETEEVLGTPPRTTVDETDGGAEGSANRERAGGQSEKSVAEWWKWTWLGDRGPLFSSESETEWVLNRLCLLLEQVAQKEARQLRGR